ncbi:hypothetical protein HPB50_011468 [Hyalomma asiaticum]|uniref:Uncharacterized protein n=1 Tax=Hyalomma asiaticum TaxID=266040 RepID=A0ACB7T219_HYAAI|nr:hypothetical protein HPB50_011468 [Hyalomma asiaticum]
MYERISKNYGWDPTVMPRLPYALTVAALSSSVPELATSVPEPTTCPLCGIAGDVTRDCRATLCGGKAPTAFQH